MTDNAGKALAIVLGRIARVMVILKTISQESGLNAKQAEVIVNDLGLEDADILALFSPPPPPVDHGAAPLVDADADGEVRP